MCRGAVSGGLLMRRTVGVAAAPPFPWQQFREAGGRQVRDAGKDIGKPSLGVDVVQPRCHDERQHDGRAVCAAVGTGEEPCFSSASHTAQRSFRGIIRCALLRCTILPGSSPGRQTLAPAGSTRGGSGGDEWSEALREKAPSGGQRTVRAATRVNTEQASKQPMWEPTRPNNGEGRSQRGSERDTHPTIPPG